MPLSILDPQDSVNALTYLHKIIHIVTVIGLMDP